jgi:hypothetical protein
MADLLAVNESMSLYLRVGFANSNEYFADAGDDSW